MNDSVFKDYNENKANLSKIKYSLVLNMLWVTAFVMLKEAIIKYTLGGYALGGGMDIDGVDIYNDIAHLCFNAILAYVVLRHLALAGAMLILQQLVVIYFNRKVNKVLKGIDDDK